MSTLLSKRMLIPDMSRGNCGICVLALALALALVGAGWAQTAKPTFHLTMPSSISGRLVSWTKPNRN